MTAEERQKAEEAVRAELDRASSVRRSIFISFAAEDIDDVNLLRAQARNEHSDVAFVDRSVREPYDSDRAEYIRQRISERIKQCSMTVVYLSNDAAGSRWVNWEVQRSLELGKNVLAVHSGDKPPRQLPSAIKDNNVSVVPWKGLADRLKPD